MTALPSRTSLRPWVARMVRVGYASKGVIYILIGALALQLALGDGGRLTDSSGVLRTLVDKPLGLVMLTVIAIGLLSYAGWEVAGALWDTGRQGSDVRGWLKRSLTILKGLVYGALGWEAMQTMLGVRSTSRGADAYARDAMRLPLGGWVIVLVGLGMVSYGLHQMWMAWQSRFDADLDQRELRRAGAGWVLTVGRAGIGARSVLLTVMGLALIRAGFDRRPSEATGMAGSLWTLLSQPYGSWLLAITAAGLVCFGVFQLLHARYARL